MDMSLYDLPTPPHPPPIRRTQASIPVSSGTPFKIKEPNTFFLFVFFQTGKQLKHPTQVEYQSSAVVLCSLVLFQVKCVYFHKENVCSPWAEETRRSVERWPVDLKVCKKNDKPPPRAHKTNQNQKTTGQQDVSRSAPRRLISRKDSAKKTSKLIRWSE